MREKGKIFLTVEHQLINAQEMMELENHLHPITMVIEEEQKICGRKGIFTLSQNIFSHMTYY